MSKEFKKIVEGKQTRYVLESATSGATSSAAVSSNSAAVPGIKRRSSLLTPEAKQKVPQKPRQGPLRPQTGAGKHKDKKRDDKQGKAKHKKPFYEDHEVSMASNELKSIYADAKELLVLVQKYGEQGDLEAWQQSKITKAADYLNSVLQSIGGEHTDLDELKMNKATDQEKIEFFKMQADRFKKQGFPKAADQAHQQAKSYQPKKVMELEKPSGTLYIILLRDRSESVRVIGDFGTFPAEVQARASKVGLKDKEGRKERPLKVNFLMTSASQALAELDKALADVDFIGGEKAEFVFKNSAFETDIEDEVKELADLIQSGADERFKNYEEPEVGNEPDTKPKGVDHFVVGPDGKRRRVPIPGKPSSQLGGHAVQQPKTYTYRLQRTDLAPKLRDMGFKFDGNNIILSKQQRDQLLAKMGDKQFGMIFGQGDRFAEGWKGGMAGAGIGAALTRSPSGAMTGYKVGSAIGDMVGKKESEEHMNQTVIDLHREIYGFGPGKQFVYEWQKMSYDEKAKIYNKLKHLAGKLEEARYGRNHNPDSYSGSMPGTDKIPQDSTAGQDAQQRMERKMKQQTIDRLLDRHPDWERSDLELASLPELIQMLREGIPYSYGFVPGRKKPNATTRHLRDYPVSDKDVAKPVKKPEKKKPEQGVAEATGDNKFDTMMGNIKKSAPVSVTGYVAVEYASENKSDRIKGATLKGKPMPSSVDRDDLDGEIEFEPDEIERHLIKIGRDNGWSIIDPGHGRGYSELFFDTNANYTSDNQSILAKNIVNTVNQINKFFNGLNSSLQSTGLPGYRVAVWQEISSSNGQKIGDIDQIKQIALTKVVNSPNDPGELIGKAILRELPAVEQDEYDDFTPEDFAYARKIAKIYITKGERAGLEAQISNRRMDHVSDLIDELLSLSGAQKYRTLKLDDLDEQGVAEGSLETDNMVSHIGQIIQSIYPRGGDKNTYMKLVAREMPRIVKANPKLFRRAFGMAYDRFFHIDQDDDFDYTDYSMRKGERGMAEVRGNIDADQAGFYVVDEDGNAVSGPFASKQEAYERAAEMGRMYDVKYKGDIIPLDSLISKIIKTLPPDVTSDDLQDPMDLEQQLEILRSPLLKVFSKLSPYEQAEVTDEVANHFYDRRFGDLDEEKQKGVDGKACWKGYKRMGTKKKGGRTVDNCVKVGEDAYSESLMNQLNSIISEKAPPGDKYERMVKHIKKGYAKDGKISDKERSIAYATAWKAKNKAKK